MFYNAFKTAWRNLLRKKTFAGIHILGLAIGIGVFLLIANYLRFEYSYDDYQQNADRIVRVPMILTEKGGEPQTFAFTYPALAPAIKKDYPEVKEAVRFRRRWGIVRHGDNAFNESGRIYYTDPAVFRVLSFEFEKGNATTALEHLNDAVITHTTAVKYFGQENPIGKALRFDNEDYIVKAVLKDIPANSHLQFNILLNFDKYIQLTNGRANTSWGWSDFYTYLLLDQPGDIQKLQAKLPAFAEKYMGGDMKESGFTIQFRLQPIRDIHLRSPYDYELDGNGNLYYLKYLGWAAVLILLISLINHVNLSTAHSLERAREIGVRKVIGADRFQVVRQFLAESFLGNLAGAAIGFFFFYFSLPAFAQLVGKDITSLHHATPFFWMAVAAGILVSTLLSGFYPAFVLSSFQPIHTLKSTVGLGSGQRSGQYFQKSLVVLQFATAIILTAGAIGFYQQLRFMSRRDLGVDIRQTLVLEQTVSQDSSARKNIASFFDEIRAIPGVTSVTASTDVPGNEVGSSTGFQRKNSMDNKSCRTFGVDEKFFGQYGIGLAAGRSFDKDEPYRDDSTQLLSVMLNATAARIFGYASPQAAVGQLIHGANHDCRIIGVIYDYHQQSLQYSYDPIVFFRSTDEDMGQYSLKLETTRPDQVVDQVRTIWMRRFPQSPFTYSFLDQRFNAQYQNDRLFSSVLWWFTLLSVLVASLGLFGLSLYSISKRTKEVGLRKVLGASVTELVALLSREYLKLVLIAGAIALPLAWLLLQGWLRDYAFHIEVGPLLLLLPLLLILVIALLTVAWHSARAAMRNPVVSLRTE